MTSPRNPAKRVWLFDLDNTLHDANPHIFPHINRAMCQYLERHLGLDPAEASKLREHYWVRYGATLLGLMRHHRIDPGHFLQETHQFPALKDMLVFDRSLRYTLRRLPGRKIVFSNAPGHYANAVLALTGLAGIFDSVYAMEDLRYQPKPMLAGFRTLLRSESLAPRQCIMIEDSLANLVSAKKMGMKTVWVSTGSRNSPYVDLKIARLCELPRKAGQL